MKLFVDANTLVSGLLFAGNERLLLELGRFGVCELITNAYVREEVIEVLGRSHLRLSEEDQRRLIAWLGRSVTVIADPTVEMLRAAKGRVSDAEDLPVLVGFEYSGCDHLVTGDRKLREEVPKAVSTRQALELILGKFE